MKPILACSSVLLFTLLVPTLVSAQTSKNLYLESSSTTLSTTPTKITVFMNPPQPVSAFAFKLNLPSGTNVVNQSGKPVDEITIDPSFATGSSWLFPFKKVVRQGDQIHIEFAGANVSKTGFITQTSVPVATFHLVSQTAKSAQLSFDAKDTAVMTKSQVPQNIATFASPALELKSTPPSFLARLLAWFSSLFKN
jgi:hypothetical protein